MKLVYETDYKKFQTAAAAKFAREHFAEPRKVSWMGIGGTFQLVGDEKTYQVKFVGNVIKIFVCEQR